MVWTSSDPGAGNPGLIRHEAQVRDTLASTISDVVLVGLQSVVSAQGTAAWTGIAATAFFETAAGYLPEVTTIVGGLTNDADALHQYANDVESIKNDALALGSAESEVQSDLSRWNHKLNSLESLSYLIVDPAEQEENRDERRRYEGYIEGANWTLREYGRQWELLASRRSTADGLCVAKLSSEASRGGLAAVATAGDSSDKALLDSLSGLSAAELAILFALHPELADRIAAIDNPELVARWWAGFGDPLMPGVITPAQQALIFGMPQVIGNLNGVPLATRVEANKLNIAAAKAELEAELAQLWATQSDSGVDFSAYAKQLSQQIAYYDVLLTETVTFVDGDGNPVSTTGHNIVYFDAEADAIAEYSGLLDPVTGGVPDYVQNLGIYIPGMNSTILSFGNEVVRSEVFTDEYPGTVAMITWKGGEFPDVWGVASGPNAAQLGAKLADFSHSLYGMPDTVDVVGMGYSFGGSVLGNAEAAGLALDRSLQISGAGMGDNVTSLDDYPNSSDAPHYSFMAPEDYVVGPIQGIDAGDLGHGASPLSTPGVIQLETGWNIKDDPTSGLVQGHEDIWKRNSTAHDQMEQVLIGGSVELYAEPEIVITYTGPPVYISPLYDSGYEPVMQDVPGGAE